VLCMITKVLPKSGVNLVMDQKSTSTAMDYAASEVQSSIGLPPAYSKPASDSLKMARMISKTLLGITAMLGFVILTSFYIQARASRDCACYRGAESRNGPYYEPLTAESGEDGQRKLPVSIQMNGPAGDLLMKRMNTKGHVNCVVERKAATQIIASEPKMLITPYGNITTDPRLIHLSGEKMTFTCKSANKEMPNKKNAKKDKEANDTVESRSKRSTSVESKSECACNCAC